jgi:hypothetical protein
MKEYMPLMLILVALSVFAFADLVAPGLTDGEVLSDVSFVVASMISVTGSVLALRNERAN